MLVCSRSQSFWIAPIRKWMFFRAKFFIHLIIIYSCQVVVQHFGHRRMHFILHILISCTFIFVYAWSISLQNQTSLTKIPNCNLSTHIVALFVSENLSVLVIRIDFVDVLLAIDGIKQHSGWLLHKQIATKSQSIWRSCRHCYFGTNCHCKSVVFTMVPFFLKYTAAAAASKSMESIKVLKRRKNKRAHVCALCACNAAYWW